MCRLPGAALPGSRPRRDSCPGTVRAPRSVPKTWHRPGNRSAWGRRFSSRVRELDAPASQAQTRDFHPNRAGDDPRGQPARGRGTPRNLRQSDLQTRSLRRRDASTCADATARRRRSGHAGCACRVRGGQGHARAPTWRQVRSRVPRGFCRGWAPQRRSSSHQLGGRGVSLRARVRHRLSGSSERVSLAASSSRADRAARPQGRGRRSAHGSRRAGPSLRRRTAPWAG